MTVSGRCHCGAVTIEVPLRPDSITQCHCSICGKLGMLWAYYPDAEVRVAGATQTYICNKRVIAFHRCSICGCTAYWQTLGRDFGRMGVNARLLEGIDLAGIRCIETAGPG